MAYAKLYLPRLLRDIDQCIYLDGDLLVLTDITGMLDDSAEEVFSECYLAAAPDYNLRLKQGNFFDRHKTMLGLEEIHEYVNSGVLVMNLRKMREDHITEKMLSCMDRDFIFPDQDILNMVCAGRIRQLPVKWNVNPANLYEDELIEMIPDEEDRVDLIEKKVNIVHFAGRDKPWICAETIWERKWTEYLEMLPDTELTADWKKTKIKNSNGGNVTSISELADKYHSYMIYGFTKDARHIVRKLRENGISGRLCFIDNDPCKNGAVYEGVSCMTFENAIKQIDNETIFIITAQQSWEEIYRMLLEQGIGNEKIFRYRLRDRNILTI